MGTEEQVFAQNDRCDVVSGFSVCIDNLVGCDGIGPVKKWNPVSVIHNGYPQGRPDFLFCLHKCDLMEIILYDFIENRCLFSHFSILPGALF
ncbi:MAG: hypothetical protein ACD_75C01677G0001 [uncultured bacterium]|nr:MAG: hypothetical protein ACD_75C01677G0001 [uncultured bacterium]